MVAVTWMLGVAATNADWDWHLGGRQKARARRAQRARESQAARRHRVAREAPDPPLDPCDCRNWCPQCDHRCLGGHAYSPTRHWCPEGHAWDGPRDS